MGSVRYDNLKIMSINIEPNDQYKSSSVQRRNVFTNMIEDEAPDIICLQNVYYEKDIKEVKAIGNFHVICGKQIASKRVTVRYVENRA